SADVWSHQGEFRLDATIGAPPDSFAPDGQDWGLPVMAWDVMARNDYSWWRRRCRRAAALFDGVRLDPLVRYLRGYQRPVAAPPPSRRPAVRRRATRPRRRLLPRLRAPGDRDAVLPTRRRSRAARARRAPRSAEHTSALQSPHKH